MSDELEKWYNTPEEWNALKAERDELRKQLREHECKCPYGCRSGQD